MEGQSVTLAGWVARRRDHGGITFIDLRDASGIAQVVADGLATDELRMEYCIRVTGTVRPRPDGTVNPDLATGAVEVAADAIEILSPSDPLPFMLDDRVDADETTRLEYRYLDLRRPRMAANLVARSRAVSAIRRTLEGLGFLEVETPTLVRSTPEGARDVLVPSRLQQGSFYALPQSPQLFKQLLMVAGVERYFQIARCYRDEDFRADRQIEFTQLDLEGAYWAEEDVQATIEAALAAVVEDLRRANAAAPVSTAYLAGVDGSLWRRQAGSAFRNGDSGAVLRLRCHRVSRLRQCPRERRHYSWDQCRGHRLSSLTRRQTDRSG